MYTNSQGSRETVWCADLSVPVLCIQAAKALGRLCVCSTDLAEPSLLAYIESTRSHELAHM